MTDYVISTTVSGLVLNSNDTLTVLSGATAFDTIVKPNAQVFVSSGGATSGTIISGNGLETISGGGSAVGGQVISAIGFNGGIINNGGFISGAVLTGSIVGGNSAAAGFIQVYADENGVGGVDSGVIVNSGGMEQVWQGTAINTVVNSGGIQYVIDKASGTIVNSGGLAQAAVGTITNATVYSGGVLSVGDEYGDGGTAVNAVLSGGTEIVEQGGITSNTTIGNGGSLILNSGSDATGSIIFAPGAAGSLTIAETSMPTGVVSGFDDDDVLDFSKLPFAGTPTAVFSGSTLIVTDNGSSYSLEFDPTGDYSNTSVTFTADSSGGSIAHFAACFLRGTRIATPSGETAVENLQAGDLVVTAAGRARPIRWIGHRSIRASSGARGESFDPVCIRKHAIAEGKPRRDLWVTPDHAILVDGRLVPVKLLVNGASIRQAALPDYTYFHLELDTHDLVLAEGLEAESYLRVEGTERAFANAAVVDILPPADLSQAVLQAYRERAHAPLCVESHLAKPVWKRIAARAGVSEETLLARATNDPRLRLIVSGRSLPLSARDGAIYRFDLPASMAPGAMVSLSSLSASPWSSKPWIDDRRQLGVAVRSLVCETATGQRLALPMDDMALASGWHGTETGPDERPFRWTDGMATFALPVQSRSLFVEIIGTAAYRLPCEMAAAV
jgi:antigen 43